MQHASNTPYPVIPVKKKHQLEQLGTKPKFWFYQNSEAGIHRLRTLCKIGRAGTGENWAEKMACEIATLLEIPCAHYDLATTDHHAAVISPSFVPPNGNLVHGNELLQKITAYPAKDPRRFQLRKYKIQTVIACLKLLNPLINPHPDSEKSPAGNQQTITDQFISYLILDCLIGNQDRHDENWGIIAIPQHLSSFLAPTFDHASSLACRMSDEERHKRLNTRDQNYTIAAFAQRAKTPFCRSDGKRLSTIDCLAHAIHLSKSANIAKQWIDKLSLITTEQLSDIINRFPDGYLSDETMTFTLEYIRINQARIYALKETL